MMAQLHTALTTCTIGTKVSYIKHILIALQLGIIWDMVPPVIVMLSCNLQSEMFLHSQKC